MTEVGGTEFVGRSIPLARLASVVHASSLGDRAAVFVSGTAGLGKTSLVRAAMDAARDAHAVVGWGTCWHGEGAPGFWPWMQAFDDVSRRVGVDEAVAAAGRDLGLLSLLVRDLGEDALPAFDPERNRVLLLEAALRWLEALAEEHHLVVVLDDLQWADPSTLDLLDLVMAAPRRSRLLVIGAFRDDDPDREVRRRLTESASRGDHIRLDGLSLADVEALVAGICGPDAASSLAPMLHERTGGHPMFVTELARLSEAGGDGRLPAAITDAVSLRLETLPEGTRSVLDAASVLGNRLLPGVLGEVTQRSATDVEEQLEPAVEAGLVRGGGDELWFSHDLFRETVVALLGVTRRRELHSRVGPALAARRARGVWVAPGDIALHLAAALPLVDVDAALAWAREAADDERARSAFGEAAVHLRRVRLASADAGVAIDRDLLVQLLIEEADHRARSGDPDAARGLLSDADRVAPAPEAVADVALAAQRLGARFATPRAAVIDQLERALDAVSGVDLIREARLAAGLARELQHSVADDRRRVGPLSERALALSRRSDDDETLIACLLARHDATWEPGTGAERALLGREIAQVGRRLADTDRVAEGLLLEANGLLEAGSAAFRPVLDQWFGLLEDRDEPRDRYLVISRRAALALLDGDADAAEHLMEQAAGVGARIHEPDTGNVFMSQRVALAGIREDPDEYLRLAVDAVDHWTGAPVLAHAVAAGACAAAGDVEAAEREVATVAASGGMAQEGSYLRSVLVTHLADAAVVLGDVNLCRSLLDDIDALTGSCGVNGAVVAFAGPFAHPAGILAGAIGDVDRGRALLDQAVDTSRRLGAKAWVRRGEIARERLDRRDRAETSRAGNHASMTRSGSVWALVWNGESANVTHAKGLNDLATLIRHRDQEIPALQLASGSGAPSQRRDEVIDQVALGAYKARLDELDADLDRAGSDADLGRLEQLEHERDQLLVEIRRSTGLGGRIRVGANDPSERARKAVSARIRDAIGRMSGASPELAAHLDRSVRTGVRCSYSPDAGDVVEWDLGPYPPADNS